MANQHSRQGRETSKTGAQATTELHAQGRINRAASPRSNHHGPIGTVRRGETRRGPIDLRAVCFHGSQLLPVNQALEQGKAKDEGTAQGENGGASKTEVSQSSEERTQPRSLARPVSLEGQTQCRLREACRTDLPPSTLARPAPRLCLTLAPPHLGFSSPTSHALFATPANHCQDAGEGSGS